MTQGEIYQGPIFQVVTDQVEHYPLEKAKRGGDLIFHNGAVAVLPRHRRWENDLGRSKAVPPRRLKKDLSGEGSSREVRKGENVRIPRVAPFCAGGRRKWLHSGSKVVIWFRFYSAIGFCNERIKHGATNLEKVENHVYRCGWDQLELLEVTLKEAKDLITFGEISVMPRPSHGHQYWDAQSINERVRWENAINRWNDWTPWARRGERGHQRSKMVVLRRGPKNYSEPQGGFGPMNVPIWKERGPAIDVTEAV